MPRRSKKGHYVALFQHGEAIPVGAACEGAVMTDYHRTFATIVDLDGIPQKEWPARLLRAHKRHLARKRAK